VESIITAPTYEILVDIIGISQSISLSVQMSYSLNFSIIDGPILTNIYTVAL